MGDKKKKSSSDDRKFKPTWEENPHQDAPNYGTWNDQAGKWYQPIGKGKPPEGLIKKIKKPESDLGSDQTRRGYPKE